MKQREIGTSGIFASEMSMGAWAIGGGTWWGDNDDAESIRTIHAALDQGINWIDTARVYGFGHSEEVVGKAVKGRRHEVILSTKGFWNTDRRLPNPMAMLPQICRLASLKIP